MDWLSALPACTVPVAVALVLAAESGLLIGLVLPGSSLVIGVGVLAGAGLVPLPAAALSATAATVAGGAIGHRRATRQSADALLPTGGRIGRLLPGRVRGLVDRSASPWAEAVARRPVRMAAVAQFATGSRTLAPRVAARAGVPLPTMLRGTVPAALLWSWGLIALGAAAGAAAPRLNGMVAVAGLPVVIVATWLPLRRRARAAVPRSCRMLVPGGLRWLPPALAGSAAIVVTAVAVLGCCVTDAHAGERLSGSAALATATHSVDEDRILAEVAAAAVAGGSIAVVVLDADGRSLVTGPEANSPIHSASLVKVFVVAQLFVLDAAGFLSLTDTDLDSMQRAIVASDDDAMNALWTRYDGAQLVRDVAATMPLPTTSPPPAAGQWGQTTTTAADVAGFLVGVDDLLHPEDAATVLSWMRSTTGDAADGFDQRFGLLAAGAGGAAAKQGWMCCVEDRRQLHSAGVLEGGRVIVLLGDFPGSVPWSQAATALDTAATATRRGTAAAD